MLSDSSHTNVEPVHVSLPLFEPRTLDVNGATVFLTIGGNGPPLLLLHGFPETHIAWRNVAPRLSAKFTVVAADLPGYGKSEGPASDDRHEPYSKRAMARTLVEAMAALGYPRFSVIGHDRGARVAYRMALDHPDRIAAVGVLDVIATLDVAERLTYATARQMATWFWLAQPPPLPENTIAANPRGYVTFVLEAWGGTSAIGPEAVDEYVRAFSQPRSIHAICEEYRAGDTVDIDIDRKDRDDGRHIACPLLCLWVEHGFAAQFGDPIEIWKRWASDVKGQSIGGGHFMMEESPEVIAAAIESFVEEALQDAGARGAADASR